MSTLAIIVALSVIGQLCLPLIGAYRNARDTAKAKKRARLLETAADRQASKASQILATMPNRDQGVSK